MAAGQRRVAVIGQRGQIARAMGRLAARHGLPLVFLARPELDLSRPETIERAIHAARPGLIVLAGAFTSPDLAETHDLEAHGVNGLAPGFVGEAARSLGCPVIHLSTDAVYGGFGPGPLSEDAPTRPLSVYGRSKLAGEAALAESGADLAILRLSAVYSPDARFSLFRRLVETPADQVVTMTEGPVCQPTSAIEVAMALWVLAGRMMAGHMRGRQAVYHLATQGSVSMAGFAGRVLELRRARTGQAPGLRLVSPAEAGEIAERPTRLLLDCAAIERDHAIRLPSWEVRLGRILSDLYPFMPERPVMEDVSGTGPS